MKQFIVVAFVVLVAVQLIPTTDAFIIKTVSFEKALPTLPSPDAAVAAITASKNALVQSVSQAVTEKVNTLTSLVSNLVQLKLNAKRDILRTTINAGSGVVQSVNGIFAAKPTVFTKTISVGFRPLFTTTLLPATTTATSGVVTTTSGQSSGYQYRTRAY